MPVYKPHFHENDTDNMSDFIIEDKLAKPNCPVVGRKEIKIALAEKRQLTTESITILCL
jgi:hypothetical protein